MSSWMETVKRVYKEGKAKDPSYTFTQALKDAKGQYKKGSPTERANKRSHKGTRKNKKTRRGRKRK